MSTANTMSPIASKTNSNQPPTAQVMTHEEMMDAQKNLWEVFGKPDHWTQAKFYLVQMMQSFLIETFRFFVSADCPCLREHELYSFVRQHLHLLIRRNGIPYSVHDPHIDKVITGTLYGAKFFEKD